MSTKNVLIGVGVVYAAATVVTAIGGYFAIRQISKGFKNHEDKAKGFNERFKETEERISESRRSFGL